MTQNKTSYCVWKPYCVRCGEVIRFPSGESISKPAYEGLKGICNECFRKMGGTVNDEEKQNQKSAG